MELRLAEAQQAVYQKWKTEWAILHPDIPYQLPNEHFDEPEPFTGMGTDVSDPIVPNYWIAVGWRLTPGVQYTLGEKGKRLYRREGRITCQIFGPENFGTAGHTEVIDMINDFLEGESFSGLDSNGAVNVIEVGAEGKWYQYSASYSFAFYEQK